MRRKIRRGGAAVALALVTAGCGGEVVGIGNSGNRFFGAGTFGEVGKLLAEHEGTPQVTDAVVQEIYRGILERARGGDPDAAMILLVLAEKQRGEE